jgi:hypothetical protein
MTTIIEERLARLLSDDVHLRSGKGSGANGTVDVCMVQAADWLAGGKGQTDQPDCVSRKIGKYCIYLNDSKLFEGYRDLLKPYCAKLVGTAGESGDREVRRAYLLADYAVRVFVPIWLRADPKHRFDEKAAALEALAPIMSEETRQAARAAARDAASAASAAYAAYAASAASAASAAYAAYAAYAARTKVLAEFGDILRAKALECLDAVIAVQ